ncbi:VOC family protein [Anaerorhabdus sp.]|uniref:VOC family protein n=1 Tax=Anaerorhabdus sp. TaxID=1872524 RepID=UPI002FCAFFD8
MKYCGSLYVALNKEETVKFYNEILGLRVIQDFGTNFTMTGGFAFQTLESWAGFIGMDSKDIKLGACNGELYFETDDLDTVIKKLNKHKEIEYVHKKKVHNWGQVGLRIYDPNHHIIEISESMTCMCKRMHTMGMSAEEIAQKTGLSLKMVERYLKK